MNSGLFTFLLIGAAILVAGLIVGRFFARTVNSPMPGGDEGDARAWWFAAGRRNGDDGPDNH